MSVELVQALVSELVVSDKTLTADVARSITNLRFSLGVDRTTQLEVTLEDPGLRLLTTAPLHRGAGIRWRDLNLTIAGRSITRGGAQEAVRIFCRATGVQRLRHNKGPRVWRNIAPHELVQQEAEAVGLRYYGETNTARRPQITRSDPAGAATIDKQLAKAIRRAKQPLEGRGANQESTWDVFQRLANEEGKVCFESADTVVFARPSWLVDRAGLDEQVRLWRWPPVSPLILNEDVLLEVPECHESDDADATTIVGQLYVDTAVFYRPGKAVLFGGDVSSFAGLYLITAVDVDPDEPLASVALSTPVDPEPSLDPAAASTAAGKAIAAAGGPASASLPAPPVGGDFGYQYDPVGGRCLGREQPGARLLADHIVAMFPGTSAPPFYVCRANTGAPDQLSVHAEGRAIDLFVPVVGGTVGDQVAAWCVANAAALGIQLVIWNRRDWNSRSRAWTSYGGPHPHRDHLHIELCWQAALHLTRDHLRAAA